MILLAVATCASLYARVMPVVFKLSVSPVMAPLTEPETVAPVAVVVPS